MRRLPLRLLAVALALIGLVVLASLEQRALRRVADRQVATAVAGYLRLAVPVGPDGGYATDRLVSTVSRLHGAGFWHAGLQVTLAGAPILDEVTPPGSAARVPLSGPVDSTSIGTVMVWDAASESGLPGASWVLAVATFLVAGLATTRRAGWLWPLLGAVLLFASLRLVASETSRTANRVAEASLSLSAPLVALVGLDPRMTLEQLGEVGGGMMVRRVGDDGRPAGPGWVVREGRPLATVQFARGSGEVVEVATAPPPVGGQALKLGLAGSAIVILLTMLPPITPRRRPRLPTREEGATIPR